MSIFDNYKRLSTEEKIKFNKSLIKRFPFLLPRKAWTGEVVEDYDYTWTEADCIPDGWLVAFGEIFLEELREELIKFDFLDKYRVVQIKEKYGSLRFYDAGCPKDSNIYDIIEKYSTLSENICIDCGKPDVPMVYDSWISPYCPECWLKKEKSYWGDKKSNTEIIDMYKHMTKDSSQNMSDIYTYTRFSKEGTQKIEIDISAEANKIREEYATRKKPEMAIK